jgi:hypothetical protein
MAKLYNLARMTTSTTGTGTITLGSAVASYVTFAAAGAQNGETVTYAIVDGNNREVGRGVYTSSGTTLTRATILESTNSNLAINLSGNAEVFITAAAEDIANVNETNTFTASQIIEVTDNTNAALRITQLGTGDAIRVEDSTTPDSTSFRVDQNGAVTAGSSITATSSISCGASNSISWTGRGIVSSPAAGGFQLGNADAAAPVAQTLSAQSVVAGTADTAGQILTIRGSRGTGSAAGGAIAIQTAPSGTAGTTQNAAVERMRIAADGNVGIGTAAPVDKLQVEGNIYLGTTSRTIYSGGSANLNLQTNTGSTLFLRGNGASENFRFGPSGQLGIAGANYGTSTQYMKSGGSGAAPSWATIASTDVSGLGTLATQSGTFSGTSSGTNTGDQNLFSTIAVSGQSSVVADTTSDTLTLVAGTNVTITTDASTDTVTIAASGGSGSTMEYIAHGVQSGTSAVSFTSIPSGYTTLYLYCQFHYAAGGRHRVALSSNNGTSYGTVRNITSAVGASGVAGGWVAISNVSASGSSKVITPSVSEVDRLDNTTNRAADIYTTTATETVITGLINALQVTCDAGNNTSTITLYGVR